MFLALSLAEAVDALIYHGVAKTRWEAVQLGRRLARETKLFRHVCGEHELRDEWLFYKFSELDEHGVESSLGSALSDSGRPRSEIAELADAFEMYVDIRDRWYHAKKYKACFIGSEAVDAMVGSMRRSCEVHFDHEAQLYVLNRYMLVWRAQERRLSLWADDLRKN